MPKYYKAFNYLENCSQDYRESTRLPMTPLSGQLETVKFDLTVRLVQEEIQNRLTTVKQGYMGFSVEFAEVVYLANMRKDNTLIAENLRTLWNGSGRVVQMVFAYQKAINFFKKQGELCGYLPLPNLLNLLPTKQSAISVFMEYKPYHLLGLLEGKPIEIDLTRIWNCQSSHEINIVKQYLDLSSPVTL